MTALKRVLILPMLLWLLAALPPRALGQQDAAKPLAGVALVVGQSDYRYLPKLSNPANDARRLEDIFSMLGFQTTMVVDLDRKRLKRAIERFAEDAEGVDVAVVYYAGHGIEAGGENWLVPVDAGIQSLASGGEELVTLSGLVADLQTRVPLVLAFLDACRSNPFPPGSVFIADDGRQMRVSEAGLAPTRGVSQAVPAQTGGGTLIGFAAEPGRAALDGPPDGNSPYAAALLRHLSAMSGLEFGTVMRMVAEEVYLRTSGQQRPWVNETLTRLIYLGGSTAEPPPEEGAILGERRQLLLSISNLPSDARLRVETAAVTAGVPMDALYGLLRALGQNAPADALGLERLLNTEAERVKALIAEQKALASEDPEIKRLAGLAAQALADGALDAHAAFWQQAKARYLEISASLDDVEAQLKARRLEGGAVLANTASALELKGDYVQAAENYALAFSEVARWDDEKAWDYRRREAGAWLSQGDEKGDDAALERSLQLYRETQALMPRERQAQRWAQSQNDIGNVLLLMGRRVAGPSMIEMAIASYTEALAVRTREAAPRDWAKTQNNLAIAYVDLAERTGDQLYLQRAAEAYRAALSETPRAEDPLVWATLMSNLGVALTRLGGDYLEEAVTVHRGALEERPQQRVPLLWAGSQENLANALVNLGKERADVQSIRLGIAAYEAALSVFTRERMPLHWSGLNYNLGNAYGDLAALEQRAAHLERAVSHYREALKEESFERTPEQWGKTQYMLGDRLWQLGEETSDNTLRRLGVKAQRDSLNLYTRERYEADWAITTYILGTRYHRLGLLEQNGTDLTEATQLLAQSLEFYTRERNAGDWADTLAAYADALASLAFLSADEKKLAEAVDTFTGVFEVHSRESAPVSWSMAVLQRASALMSLSILRNDDGPARQGRADVEAAAEVLAEQGRPDQANRANSLLPGFDDLIRSLPP